MRPRTSPSRLLLIRHGETEWNLARRRQGRLDSPLSASGADQAAQLATDLANEPIDAIFCSPLGRARATAEPIAERHSLPVTVIDELAELDMGVFAGLTDQQIESQFPGALTERALDKYGWSFPGGESYEDVDRRSAIAIRSMDTFGAATPLVVGHSMSARMLLRNLLNLDQKAALGFSLPHGVVLEVTRGRENEAQWLDR